MGNAWEDPRNPIRVLFGGERLELWSLQAVGRPAIPPPNEEASNPIDAFLDAAWRDRGIEGAPLMNQADWIQRATLDLTGLRATREEVELFVQDPAPDAWERVIDRLLASPAYGEHTARQWLDVVRFRLGRISQNRLALQGLGDSSSEFRYPFRPIHHDAIGWR
jgi:hypothetical protein